MRKTKNVIRWIDVIVLASLFLLFTVIIAFNAVYGEQLSSQVTGPPLLHEPYPQGEDFERWDELWHAPPPDAYLVCVGKSIGSPAQFVGPCEERITGRCEQDKNGKLFLRPEGIDMGACPSLLPGFDDDCDEDGGDDDLSPFPL